jgi:DNA-binding CsgD family transcriptional regulator/tetratricopeptide (TPR) repeat protein
MAGFFGRTRELADVRAACQRVLTEQRVVVVVLEGDPGCGKTRLLAEALSRGPIALQVAIASHEPERDLALALGRDLVRSLARSTQRAQECLDPFLAASNVGEQPEWAGLFEAVHRAVALSVPLLIAVDDVQWSDQTSIALLHYLIRGAETDAEPLGLVLAGRPSPALSALCVSLERLLVDRFIHIALGPLDHDAAVALVRSANPVLDDEAAERTASRSGGSPFWCELLATASSEDTDVSRLVSDRLRGVSADASALLTTAVLLARPVHVREMVELQRWHEDRIRDAIAELSATGLVVEVGASVRAAHDLVRSAVTSQIPASDRRSTHRLIASWLEEGAGEDISILLAAAQHRRAAAVGQAAIIERILRSPMRRSLGPDGLQAVVQLVDDVSPDDPRAIELQRGIAALAGDIGQHSIALQRWPRVAARLADPIERAQAWLAACDAAQHLERAEDARAYLEEALKTGRADPVLGLELSVAEASLLRWLEHRPDDSRQVTNAALARARELVASAASLETVDTRLRSVFVQTLVQACVDAMQRNAPQDILPLADEISDVAAGLDAQASVQARLRSGSALMLVGRLAEAERCLAEAWMAARRSLLSDLALDIGSWLVWTRYLMGQLVEAEEVAGECVALAARIGEHTRPAAMMQLWLRTIEVSRGNRGVALDALGTMARDETDPHHRMAIHQTIARWLTRLDGGTSAEEILAPLHAGRIDADTAGCARCRTEFLLSGSETLARAGAVTDAVIWLREGQRDADGGVFDEWLGTRARASVAVAANEAGAEEALEHAVATADGLGMGLEAIWARLDLGRLLSAGAPRSSAVLQEAYALAQSTGAATEQAVAEQLLRQSGIRTWRRGSKAAAETGRTALSPREREIARLVAEGASNVDIAQLLFLSRKTVERHVSNIFVKLGVKNRVQLAAQYVEMPQETSAPK